VSRRWRGRGGALHMEKPRYLERLKKANEVVECEMDNSSK
jgi:hypothetical protein